MLIFPYWEELRDEQIRLLPLVPVTLRHGQASTDTAALIDSGAEHSIFPLAAAEELGYDLGEQQQVMIVGVGGAETLGYATVVDYALGRERWRGPVIFSAAVAERPLLGQAGFFSFFNVTFRRYQREIRITRSRAPRVGTWPAA